ncbi:MFS transporter [Lentzea sp. NBRC 105346]|nr:MFS transporter [Lentzea sp. NBRC 105346]
MRFWAAATVSELGTHVTTLAIPTLVLLTLHGSNTDVGVLSAARWLPYLLFGLIMGVLVDRCRRLPILVTADIGRAVLLTLTALFVRDVPTLAVMLALMGLLSLGHDVASQSLLPRLVTTDRLPTANARLAQTGSAAAATGPLVGSALVKALGAPLSMVLDAVSYLVSGLLLATLRVSEPPPSRERSTVSEGLRWVYRHPTLAPLAVNTHVWMIFSAAVGAVYPGYALTVLGMSVPQLGFTYACAGVGGVLGGAVSTWAVRRLAVGRLCVLSWFVVPVAIAGMAVVADWRGAAAAQFLFWVCIGVESPPAVTHRQSVTPDRLQGRTNATIRSLNWGMVTVGAPLGGLLADNVGPRTTLSVAAAGFVVVAVSLARSRFRLV